MEILAAINVLPTSATLTFKLNNDIIGNKVVAYNSLASELDEVELKDEWTFHLVMGQIDLYHTYYDEELEEDRTITYRLSNNGVFLDEDKQFDEDMTFDLATNKSFIVYEDPEDPTTILGGKSHVDDNQTYAEYIALYGDEAGKVVLNEDDDYMFISEDGYVCYYFYTMEETHYCTQNGAHVISTDVICPSGSVASLSVPDIYVVKYMFELQIDSFTATFEDVDPESTFDDYIDTGKTFVVNNITYELYCKFDEETMSDYVIVKNTETGEDQYAVLKCDGSGEKLTGDVEIEDEATYPTEELITYVWKQLTGANGITYDDADSAKAAVSSSLSAGKGYGFAIYTDAESTQGNGLAFYSDGAGTNTYTTIQAHKMEDVIANWAVQVDALPAAAKSVCGKIYAVNGQSAYYMCFKESQVNYDTFTIVDSDNMTATFNITAGVTFADLVGTSGYQFKWQSKSANDYKIYNDVSVIKVSKLDGSDILVLKNSSSTLVKSTDAITGNGTYNGVEAIVLCDIENEFPEWDVQELTGVTEGQKFSEYLATEKSFVAGGNTFTLCYDSDLEEVLFDGYGMWHSIFNNQTGKVQDPTDTVIIGRTYDVSTLYDPTMCIDFTINGADAFGWDSTQTFSDGLDIQTFAQYLRYGDKVFTKNGTNYALFLDGTDVKVGLEDHSGSQRLLKNSTAVKSSDRLSETTYVCEVPTISFNVRDDQGMFGWTSAQTFSGVVSGQTFGEYLANPQEFEKDGNTYTLKYSEGHIVLEGLGMWCTLFDGVDYVEAETVIVSNGNYLVRQM